ncbi:MAG: hypothetical protein ACP5IZ_10555 [Thermoprotei archaeon]|jgi:hypothetical protein
MKGFSEYFLILLMIIIIQYSFNYASATFCDNGGSGQQTWVYVEAFISGSSAQQSSGYGYETSGFHYPIHVCPGGPYLWMVIFSEYENTYYYFWPIGWSVRQSFPISASTAGRYIGVSIEANGCKDVRPGVVAFLGGTCGY